MARCTVKRGTVEAGRAERVAPGVVRQRLVQPDTRWFDAGTTENLSQGQLRPSSLRGPVSRTPRARPPIPAATAGSDLPSYTYFKTGFNLSYGTSIVIRLFPSSAIGESRRPNDGY